MSRDKLDLEADLAYELPLAQMPVSQIRPCAGNCGTTHRPCNGAHRIACEPEHALRDDKYRCTVLISDHATYPVGRSVIVTGEQLARSTTSAIARCAECQEPVDEDGDCLIEGDCPMTGMGWTHADDCQACGHVVCDRSC